MARLTDPRTEASTPTTKQMQKPLTLVPHERLEASRAWDIMSNWEQSKQFPLGIFVQSKVGRGRGKDGTAKFWPTISFKDKLDNFSKILSVKAVARKDVFVQVSRILLMLFTEVGF